MAKLLTLLLIIGTLTSQAMSQSQVNYDGSQLLRLTIKSPAQLKAVQLLETLDFGVDFWLDPSLHRPTDVFVPKLQLIAVTTYLGINSIEYEVSIPDVGALIADQKRSMEGKQDGEMKWDNYQGWETIMDYVDRLAVQYPNLATVTTYGESTEGRPLKVIKIGRNTTANKPAFFFDGGMHAREWVSPAVVTWFMNELLTDQESNRDILDGIDIYITPVANPDGYEYSRNADRMWRKTRSFHGSPLRCYGVDPNRNFEVEWGGDGTSGNMCSDIFHGPFPFSEPETGSMAEFVTRKKYDEGVNWVSYFAIHSYAQMWLTPWGYTYDLPETYFELREFGEIGAAALRNVHGTQYRVGSVTELLTPGAGGSDDWAFGTGLFRYSQTVEVRDTGRYGFLLPPDQIVPCAEETFAAIQAVARFVMNNNA